MAKEIVTDPLNKRRTPFSPQFLNPVVWYDPSDLSTITESGGAVSQLSDKSANAAHLLQPNGVDQPLTGQRTIGGRNALDYDGLSHFLDLTSFPMPDSGDISLFWVAEIDQVTGASQMMVSTKNDSNYHFNLSSGNTTQFDGVMQGPGFFEVLDGGPYNGPNMFNFEMDFTVNGEATVYVDGTKAHASTETYSSKVRPPMVFRVGRNNNEAFPLDFAHGEIVAVERCSGDARKRMEGYLAHRWGLAGNLPVDHPYKNDIPRI